LNRITICSKSGYRSTSLCGEIDSIMVVAKGLETTTCPYHKKIHLSSDNKFRVNSECERVDNMNSTGWFVLPPVQEYYFRSKNLSYHPLPPFRKDCANPSSLVAMDLIYPKANSRIYIPKDLNGGVGSTVFQVAHRSPTATIYWHLDGEFIGSTKKSHHFALTPGNGEHTLTLVDEEGETLERQFQVLSTR
jgi:penicillin-binding protein 1C